MKHLKLLFTALLLLCGSVTSAHDFEVDGIYYNIIDSYNSTVAVTYKGSSYMEYNNEYSGNVVIPENVTCNGIVYNVTRIGSYAFCDCTELTSVEIPNSVTFIDDCAFWGCSELTSVKIPDSVTFLGLSAFKNCIKLANIEIPDCVTTIKKYAFDNTAWYDSQAEGIVYVGKVLYKYKGTMPENTVVLIPEGTLSIAESAFYECKGLTTVIIPASLIELNDRVFEGCSSLADIIVKNGNTKYDSRENCNAVIKTESNTLVVGCKSTIIPNSVTGIGEFAFYNCTGLTSISIPNGVTTIGHASFGGCTELASITIPSSVRYISDFTFFCCSSIENIVVDDRNDYFDSRENCNAIIETSTNTLLVGCENTIIPDGVTAIGHLAFSGRTGLTSITIPNSVTRIEDGAFYECTGLESIKIPNSVTSIGSEVFYGCKSLIDVEIPNSVKELGYYMFSNCTNLVSVTLPAGLTSVDEFMFSNCSNLISIEIPKGVTSIGYSAFQACTGLKSITIPEKVTTIGNNAFGSCFRLAEIYMECETPPVINQNTFYGVNATLYVPYGTKEAYQSADYWSAFTNILEMDPTQITINVDHSGYGTFCSSYALDFSELEELKAYSAIGFNTDTEVVTLARIMTAAPETGIFVKGEPGTYIVPVVEECNEHTLNLLVGTLDETVVNSTSDSYSNYEFVVSAADGSPMFADNSTLAAGKAYLKIPTSWLPVTAQNCIGVRFEDSETTYVDDIVEFESADTGTIYDLTGRAVENPGNGVYIVNGKKVFIK